MPGATSGPGRWLRLTRHVATHGLPTALRYLMSSPTPLDPKFVWSFVTHKQPRVMVKR